MASYLKSLFPLDASAGFEPPTLGSEVQGGGSELFVLIVLDYFEPTYVLEFIGLSLRRLFPWCPGGSHIGLFRKSLMDEYFVIRRVMIRFYSTEAYGMKVVLFVTSCWSQYKRLPWTP